MYWLAKNVLFVFSLHDANFQPTRPTSYWFNLCHPLDLTVHWLDKIFVSIMVKSKYDFKPARPSSSWNTWRVQFVRLLEFGVNEWYTNKGIIGVVCGNKYMHYRNLFLSRHVCNCAILVYVFYSNGYNFSCFLFEISCLTIYWAANNMHKLFKYEPFNEFYNHFI